MILLIDNYDSFSYNLYQMIGAINSEKILVIRNDEKNVDDIKKLAPSHVIISPGPGRPENAGIIIDAIKFLGENIPILGVCLGHQAICAAYGAKIIHAKKLMHGKQSEIEPDTSSALFKNFPSKIKVARYHSLAVDFNTVPDCLKITAKTTDGEIMAIEHKNYPIYGVQFHPESIMTPEGHILMNNFLKL